MEEFEQTPEENFEQNTRPQPPRRSVALLILCILTFINSGCSAVSYLFMPTIKSMMPMLEDYYDQLGYSAIYEQNATLFESIGNVADWKFVLVAISYVLAVVGAAMMLKMKKLGFHLYVIAQLLGFCFLNFLIGAPLAMNATSIIWTVMFILLYFFQMRPVLQKKEDE